MIEKQLTYFGKTASGVFCQALFGSAGVFEKTAGAPAFADWDTGDALRKYIKTITKEDRKKYCYTLVNALGAGEYYGSNINSDYFPWNSLAHEGEDYGYKTFEYFAHAFQHHKNKDPSRAFGIPVLSVLNHPMKRVELIVRLDRAKSKAEGADGLITRIDAGDFPDVSMGCRVPFDVCSVCRHKSKTKDDYCEHMRPPEELRHIYGPNRILFDGRKIFVFNFTPKFFDISFVFIGADKTAKVMAKLASRGDQLCMGDVCTIDRPSADVAEDVGPKKDWLSPSTLQKVASAESCGCGCTGSDCIEKSASQKLSTIIKQIPAGPFALRRLKDIENHEPLIPDKTLDSMSKHHFPSLLGSLMTLGIVLKPQEYQRVVLKRMGEDELADDLSKSKKVFAPSPSFGFSDVDPSSKDTLQAVLPLLSSLIKERTAFGGPFQIRVTITGGGHKFPLPTPTPVEHPLLDKISAAYNGYRRELLMKLSQATEVVEGDPQLREMVLGDGLVNMFSKQASSIPTLSVDSLAYMMGAYLEDRSLLSSTATATALAVANPSLLAEEQTA